MKNCTVCKQKKPRAEFNKNKSRKDGLQTICRKCSNEKSRQYYRKNKEGHINTVYQRKVRNRRKNQGLMLAFLSSGQCADCSLEDVRVLEFDHRDASKKKYNISDMLTGGFGWDAISLEMQKCDLVCANCHRIRHLANSNSYRVRGQ